MEKNTPARTPSYNKNKFLLASNGKTSALGIFHRSAQKLMYTQYDGLSFLFIDPISSNRKLFAQTYAPKFSLTIHIDTLI